MNRNRRKTGVSRYIAAVLLAVLCGVLCAWAGVVEKRPNIVIILADDQGYGDIKALHSACPISTPNMDRLCAEGAVFTEAYSPSAFCAPSRYSLLTGRYTWRTYVKIGFPQHNFGSGPVPDPLPPYPTTERMTVQRMLAKLGYRNAVVGKWHLVTPPNDIDFHYSFLHDGYFVKNKRFQENGEYIDYTEQLFYPPSLAPGTTHSNTIAAGESLTNDDIGLVLPETTERAVDFIEDHLTNYPGRPFFLYYTPHTMHTPYNVPTNYHGIDFTAMHGTGPNAPDTPHNYLNFLELHDYCVGRILDTLDTHGVASNTIVFYSSDNGGLGYAWSIQVHPDAGAPYNAPRGSVNDSRYNSSPWSVNVDRYGFKTMSHDGGVRVPLMVRWPGEIAADLEDATPRCLTDIFLTLADILHVPFGPEVAEDSFSFADVLLGEGPSARDAVVHHSRYGHLGLRAGDWKLIHADGHGGGGTFNGVTKGDAAAHWTTDASALQLFDFSGSYNEAPAADVSAVNAARVQSMVSTLAQYYGDTNGVGRSRPNTPLDLTSDYDLDGTPDYIEFENADRDLLDPYDAVANHDADGDGALKDAEKTMGTHPNKVDTDGDGLWDGAEDKNQDGIMDTGETDPCDPDSDDDGFDDFAERVGGSDPRSASSTPSGIPPEDADSDGIPDTWEIARVGHMDILGGTYSGTSRPRDYDGDGQSDLHEYLASTQVLNAADHFSIQDCSSSYSQVTLQWRTVVGREYQVQHTSDLLSGSWETLSDVYTATTARASAMITVPGGGGSRSFLRVRVNER